MSKILVTGGAGFIGSNFARFWQKNHPEDHIIVLDALTYAGHLESLKDVLGEKCVFVKGNITDAKLVDKTMAGVDIVVHFAAESHVDRSITDPMVFIKTNVLGTGVLLDSALRHKISRFHHISTDEVYGHLGLEDPPFTESTPYAPRTPYSASKAGSDHLVRAYFETYQLPITISNCANNFGPYHHPEKLIPLFITNLLTGKKVPLMGKGDNIRSWLQVEDHCRAIELILEKGTIGETYCIGGEEKTNLEVTMKLLDLLGQGEDMIEHIEHRKGHDFRYALDSSKIEKLGWKPEHNFDQWIEKTVQWFKDNKNWWEPLKF